MEFFLVCEIFLFPLIFLTSMQKNYENFSMLQNL